PAATNNGLAYDLNRNLAVQFGGTPLNGDTWLFDGSSWRRDPRTTAPPARMSFALANDFLRGRTVAFGGYTGAYFGDTWEYDPGVVATWSAFGGGCAGTAG